MTIFSTAVHGENDLNKIQVGTYHLHFAYPDQPHELVQVSDTLMGFYPANLHACMQHHSRRYH